MVTEKFRTSVLWIETLRSIRTDASPAFWVNPNNWFPWITIGGIEAEARNSVGIPIPFTVGAISIRGGLIVRGVISVIFLISSQSHDK